MLTRSPASSAKGTTLAITHGNTASAIHAERRRVPRSARSMRATIGMSTTVSPTSSVHSTTTIPADNNGAKTTNGTRPRRTSGRHPTTAPTTPSAVTSVPWRAASTTITGASTTTGSHVANAGERRARASIAPRILGREEAAVGPAQQRRRPPVPAAEQRHQRRDEQRPHHEGVDQHAGGRGDPDLLDERDGAGRERPDRHREQDRGRGHDAPGGGQAGGDRLALLARALALLADAPEQEHAVVRGQREDDRRRHQEIAGLHAAVRRVAQQALQA